MCTANTGRKSGGWTNCSGREGCGALILIGSAVIRLRPVASVVNAVVEWSTREMEFNCDVGMTSETGTNPSPTCRPDPSDATSRLVELASGAILNCSIGTDDVESPSETT